MENNQRSPEWFKERSGRFTGSEIHKLMGIKGLGKTGESYAFKKAVEVVFGVDEEDRFVSFAMQKGIDLEPIAFRKFKELKALEFKTVMECGFFAKGDNGGASPDGLVDNNAVLEIKCCGSEKFFNLVAGGAAEIDSEYICQMQDEMRVTNSTHAYFFNYIVFKSEEMWHEIIVQRDEVMIAKIEARIAEAVILRDNFIVQLNKNKQF